MVQPEELREQTAARLLSSMHRVTQLRAFLGLDGFVDEIVHVVDKRDNAAVFHRLPTIIAMSQRLAGAAGHSTNVELVNQRTKLGGNGPIMANALARLGVKVTYVGALGYPQLHPVFTEFARNAEVHGIADPGHTDALEFEDGKLMLTKTTSLNEVTWENIQRRYGRGKFIDQFSTADLVGFVNWTMIPFMSALWASLLQEFCPVDHSLRRKIFFDLADPEKRTPQDIAHALELITAFEKYFEVILGLNEKEAFAVGDVLGVNTSNRSRDGLATVTAQIQKRTAVGTLVVHPITYAIATSGDSVTSVDGPFVEKPLITTGAGDHFNSGFCLGKLLGFDNPTSVLCGVSASGHYVRSGQSPSVEDLAAMMRAWPNR